MTPVVLINLIFDAMETLSQLVAAAGSHETLINVRLNLSMVTITTITTTTTELGHIDVFFIIIH